MRSGKAKAWMNRLRTLEVIIAVGLVCGGALAASLLVFNSNSNGTSSTYCGGLPCTTQVPPSTTTVTMTTTSLVTLPELTTSTTVTKTHTITITNTTTVTRTDQINSSLKSLGFWLQDTEITGCFFTGGYNPCSSVTHPAQTFFNAMFLTPPYPSSLDMMMFGPVVDENAGAGCSTSAGQTGADVSFFSDLASLADSYPNIRLIYDIAFNASSSVYGFTCFQSMLQAFASHPSVYGIGIEGEYFTGTRADVQTAFNMVVAAGKQFISYYLNQKDLWPLPEGGHEVKLTNFPMQGGQVDTLQLSDPQFIGLATGYYAHFPFPVPNAPPPNGLTCPIGPNDIAPANSDPTTNPNQGFNQCVISTIINATLTFSPASERQFLELCVGFNGKNQGPFTGVSGQSTTQLWDNPTLRSWIWTDPNYYPNFMLSEQGISK